MAIPAMKQIRKIALITLGTLLFASAPSTLPSNASNELLFHNVGLANLEKQSNHDVPLEKLVEWKIRWGENLRSQEFTQNDLHELIGNSHGLHIEGAKKKNWATWNMYGKIFSESKPSLTLTSRAIFDQLGLFSAIEDKEFEQSDVQIVFSSNFLPQWNALDQSTQSNLRRIEFDQIQNADHDALLRTLNDYLIRLQGELLPPPDPYFLPLLGHTYLQSLDPHSKLQIAPLRRSRESIHRDLDLRIRLANIAGNLLVKTVNPNSIAQLAGLNEGDKILSINGVEAEEFLLSDGRVNHSKLVAHYFKSRNQTLEFIVSRAIGPANLDRNVNLVIPVAVTSANSNASNFVRPITSLVEESFVYRIDSWPSNSSHLIREDFYRLGIYDQPERPVILDLRDNPGGVLLESALFFQDTGIQKSTDVNFNSNPLVTLFGIPFLNPGRTLKPHHFGSLPFSKRPTRLQNPLIALVNRATGSSSEVLAALFDLNSRAILIGDPTQGKGSAQMRYSVPPALEAHITNSLILVGNNHFTIQNTGVTPHIKVGRYSIHSPSKLSAPKDVFSLNVPPNISNIIPERSKNQKFEDLIGCGLEQYEALKPHIPVNHQAVQDFRIDWQMLVAAQVARHCYNQSNL